MNIDNTELLEALKLTQPPKPENATEGEVVPRDRADMADEFEERVRRIVVDKLGVSPDEVARDTTFHRDLGAEAFDIIELIMAFEEEMGFAIPEEESEKLTTFGNAVDYLRKKSQRG